MPAEHCLRHVSLSIDGGRGQPWQSQRIQLAAACDAGMLHLLIKEPDAADFQARDITIAVEAMTSLYAGPGALMVLDAHASHVAALANPCMYPRVGAMVCSSCKRC